MNIIKKPAELSSTGF